MAITLNGTTGISSPGGDTSTSLATTNLSYTGTLTGGTGVIAIGTNQIYKDASGNVGIGTASPGAKLHVYGSGNVTQFITSSNGGTIRLGLDSSGVIYNWIEGSSTVGMRFAVSDIERFRLNTNGALVLQGGNTAASGVGIAFPATQSASSDANTLDDYEEGTWTPVVGGTATYSIQSGSYTKIGRLVTLNFDCAVTTLGTGSNRYITGIPFVFSTGSGAARFAGGAAYFYGLAISSTCFYVQIDNNGIFVDITAASAASITDNPVWIQNGSRLMGSLTYVTNT